MLLLLPLGTAAAAQDAPPYRGALPPGDPPPDPRVHDPQVAAALDVLYQRPSPDGPPPVPATPRAVYAVGRGPVIQALPGPMPFAEHLPAIARTAMPAQGPYSNTVRRLSGGDIRFAGFDLTRNDTQLSRDSFAVHAEFTDAQGAHWRVEGTRVAPLSMDPAGDPWYGGVVVDTTLHGQTGRNTPAEPAVTCAMCAWAWADVYKNGRRVQSSALLHVMLTSDVRDDANGFRYACYDCTDRPVREIHLILPPSNYLPAPGGFLHVMWENAEIVRGSPGEVAARAPRLQEPAQDLVINAVEYLDWDRTEVRLRAGQTYRLILNNRDASAHHAFHLHSGGHGHGEESRGGHGHGGGHGDVGDVPQGPIPLPQASQWVTMIRFDRPGEYEFMCPVNNHHRRGMKGRFIVEAAGPPDRGGASHAHRPGRNR